VVQGLCFSLIQFISGNIFWICFQTCPSDGIVLTCGKVMSSRVEQVKGVTYSLSRFLGPANWPHADNKHIDTDTRSKDYGEQIKSHVKDTQLYQAVIYLSPGDYHRFHSPTEWAVTFRRYFPGHISDIILRLYLLLSVDVLFDCVSLISYAHFHLNQLLRSGFFEYQSSSHFPTKWASCIIFGHLSEVMKLTI